MSDEHKAVQWLEATEAADGQRLDNFLFTRLKGVPRSRIYRLIRKGEIRVNKKRCKPDQRLARGDLVRVAPIRQRASGEIAKPSAELATVLKEAVLHDDEQIMILNKPAGLAVHGGSGLPIGLIEALRQLYPQYPLLELVHRLDRETSGCLLVAKTPAALRSLQQALKSHQVEKVYQALVQGSWPQSKREVNAPLQRDLLGGGERIVRVQSDGKPARTQFRVLEKLAGATLLEARPVSGRTHQIRVHCQYAGHPILGDSKYLHRHNDRFPQVKQLCLHAAAIRFQLPDARGKVRERHFSAPLPERLERLLLQLKGDPAEVETR